MSGEVVGLIEAQEEGFADGLQECADRIIELAREYMPAHDPVRDPDPAMNLAENISAHLDLLPGGRVGLTIEVDTPYAAKQHEAMWFEHPRGGGPKYLERALTEVIPLMQGIIAHEVEARTGEWASTRGG